MKILIYGIKSSGKIISEILPIPKTTKKTTRTAAIILFISKESMVFYNYGRITC